MLCTVLSLERGCELPFPGVLKQGLLDCASSSVSALYHVVRSSPERSLHRGSQNLNSTGLDEPARRLGFHLYHRSISFISAGAVIPVTVRPKSEWRKSYTLGLSPQEGPTNSFITKSFCTPRDILELSSKRTIWLLRCRFQPDNFWISHS